MILNACAEYTHARLSLEAAGINDGWYTKTLYTRRAYKYIAQKQQKDAFYLRTRRTIVCICIYIEKE